MGLKFGEDQLFQDGGIFDSSPEDGQIGSYSGNRIIPIDLPESADTVTLTPLESALNVLEIQASVAITPASYIGVEMDVFTDADGYLDTIDTGNTTATFDTDKYEAIDLSSVTDYIIIEATSLSANWSANNCITLKLDTGKWILVCTTGTAEVQRAQMIKSLFYGTNGTDQLILDFTSVTAISTSVTRDVGKKAHYATISRSSTDNLGYNYYTATFTSPGNNCSFWSKVGGSSINFGWGEAYFPAASSVNGPSTNSDETGLDKTADEENSPADLMLKVYNASGSGRSGYAQAIFLVEGTISWEQTNSDGTNGLSYSNIDFYTDHSIPLFTEAETITVTDIPTIVQTDMITIAAGFETFQVTAFRESTTGTGSINASISFNGGTNYETFTVNENHSINYTGTSMIVKIQLNAGASAGTAECKGWGVQLW